MFRELPFITRWKAGQSDAAQALGPSGREGPQGISPVSRCLSEKSLRLRFMVLRQEGPQRVIEIGREPKRAPPRRYLRMADQPRGLNG